VRVDDIMKTFLFVLLVVAAFAGGSRTASAEVNYPWCLIMGGGDGSRNCGFVTREQCMVTRIGKDMCVPNPLYSPPPPPPPPATRPVR
jgi:hypothetical protein